MTDWQLTTIRDVSVGVYDGPHATPPTADEGPVFLGIGNVTEDGHLDLTTVRHIAEEDFGKWTKRVCPQAGDIVFTYEATLNRYAIIPEGFRGCLGRRMALIRPNTAVVDTNFLFYSFFGAEWRKTIEENRLSGATVDRIPIARFPDFQIKLPPLQQQRGIASVLAAYDDLIEVNRRRVALLEKMARALFEEWFVRFRFPGHEGLAVASATKGPLPNGWHYGTLADVVGLRRDRAAPGEHLSDRFYVPIECIGRQTLALPEARSWHDAQSSLQTFERGDILFGAMRAYFHKVCPAPVAGVTRSTVFVLTPRLDNYFSFAVMCLSSVETVAYAAAHSAGSTIPYAQWNNSLERMPVPIPPDSLIEQFDRIVRPMLEQIMASFRTQSLLASSRDLLLPRLISGQLTFPAALQALEVASNSPELVDAA